MTRRRRLPAVLVAAVLLLAGCTGIPDSSAPSTVAPVEAGDANPSAQPPKGLGARAIVEAFLDANGTAPSERASTRAFLTPAARNTWSDQTVTVIDDEQFGSYNPRTRTVLVTGRKLGSLNSAGIYTPYLQGGGPAKFTFTLTRDSTGQYRIDQLSPGLGLLIDQEQFGRNYQQHPLYFYDLAQHYLVPDLRWTAVPTIDTTGVVRLLVGQLEAGPRQDLQDVVATQTFPTQVGSGRVSVRVSGSTVVIDIPGSSQLLAAVRTRLATQLAYTLQSVLNGDDLRITDGGKTVQIPGANGASFTADTFPGATGPAPPPTALYYVRYGRVTTMDGKNVSGPLGDGSTLVTSVALARRGPAGTLDVAATEGSGSAQRLYVGTVSGGLQQTSLTGALTRPCWAPGLSEVWIGDGATLHRIVIANGKAVSDTTVTVPSIQGMISTVRISPDGSEVALVVSAVNGTSAQVYVGGIGRDSTAVSVGPLVQISPNSLVALDADWSNPQKLIVIGYQLVSKTGGVYESGVDGSFWTSIGINRLPAGPEQVTATTYGAWVESDSEVWEQNGDSWMSPSPTGSAPGTAPVYLS